MESSKTFLVYMLLYPCFKQEVAAFSKADVAEKGIKLVINAPLNQLSRNRRKGSTKHILMMMMVNV